MSNSIRQPNVRPYGRKWVGAAMRWGIAIGLVAMLSVEWWPT